MERLYQISHRWHEKSFPYVDIYLPISLIVSVVNTVYTIQLLSTPNPLLILNMILPIVFHIIDIIACICSRQFFRHPKYFWHIFGLTISSYIVTQFSSVLILIKYPTVWYFQLSYILRAIFQCLNYLRLTASTIGVQNFSFISNETGWSLFVLFFFSVYLPKIMKLIIYSVSYVFINQFAIFHGKYANCLNALVVTINIGILMQISTISIIITSIVQVIRMYNLQQHIFEHSVISLLFHEAFQKGLIGSVNCSNIINQVILLQQSIQKDYKHIFPKQPQIEKESSIILMNLGIKKKKINFDIPNILFQRKVTINNQFFIPARNQEASEQLKILVDGNLFLQKFLQMRYIGVDGIIQYIFAVIALRTLIRRFSFVNQAIFGMGFSLINQSKENQSELIQQFLQQDVTEQYIQGCIKQYKSYCQPFMQDIVQSGAIFIKMGGSKFINLPQFEEFLQLTSFLQPSIYWYIWGQLHRGKIIDQEQISKIFFPFLDQRQINLFDIYKSQPLFNRVINLVFPFLHMSLVKEDRQPDNQQIIQNQTIYRPRSFHQFEKNIVIQPLIQDNQQINVNLANFMNFKEQVLNDMKHVFKVKKNYIKPHIQYELTNIQKIHRLVENISVSVDIYKNDQAFYDSQRDQTQSDQHTNILTIGAPLSLINIFQITTMSDIFLNSNFANSKKQIEKFYIEDFFHFGQQIMGFWVQIGSYSSHPVVSTSLLLGLDIIYTDFYRIVNKMQSLKRKSNNKDVIYQLYMLVKKFRFDKKVLQNVKRQNKVINKGRISPPQSLTSKNLSTRQSPVQTQTPSCKSNSGYNSQISHIQKNLNLEQDEQGLVVKTHHNLHQKSQFLLYFNTIQKNSLKKLQKVMLCILYCSIILLFGYSIFLVTGQVNAVDLVNQRLQAIFDQNFYKTNFNLKFLQNQKTNIEFLQNVENEFNDYQFGKYESLCQYSQYQPCNSTTVNSRKTNQLNVFNKYISIDQNFLAQQSQDLQSFNDELSVQNIYDMTTTTKLISNEQKSRIFQFQDTISSYYDFFANYYYDDLNFIRQLLTVISMIIALAILYKTLLVVRHYLKIVKLIQSITPQDVHKIVDTYQKQISASIDKVVSQAVIRSNIPTRLASKMQSELQTRAPSKQHKRPKNLHNNILISFIVAYIFICIGQFCNNKTFLINQNIYSSNMQLNQKATSLSLYETNIQNIFDNLHVIKLESSNILDYTDLINNTSIINYLQDKSYLFQTLPSLDFYQTNTQDSSSSLIKDSLIYLYNLLHLAIIQPNPQVHNQKQYNSIQQQFNHVQVNKYVQDLFYYYKVAYQQILMSQNLDNIFFEYNITGDSILQQRLYPQLTNLALECQPFNGIFFENYKLDQNNLHVLQIKARCIINSQEVQKLYNKMFDLLQSQNQILRQFLQAKITVSQTFQFYFNILNPNTFFDNIQSLENIVRLHQLICIIVYSIILISLSWYLVKQEKQNPLKFQENQFFQIKIIRTTKNILSFCLFVCIIFDFSYQICFTLLQTDKIGQLNQQVKSFDNVLKLSQLDVELSQNPSIQTNLNLNWYYDKYLSFKTCKHNYTFSENFNTQLTDLLNLTSYFKHVQESKINNTIILNNQGQISLFNSLNANQFNFAYKYLLQLQLFQSFTINDCDPISINYLHQSKIQAFIKLFDSIAKEFQHSQRLINEYSFFFQEYKITNMLRNLPANLFICLFSLLQLIKIIYPIILTDFHFSVISKKQYNKKLQEQNTIMDHQIYIFEGYKFILQLFLQISPIIVLSLGITVANLQKKIYGFRYFLNKISLSKMLDYLVNELEIYALQNDLSGVQSVAFTLLNRLSSMDYGIQTPCGSILQFVPSLQKYAEHPVNLKCTGSSKYELITMIQNGIQENYQLYFNNNIINQLQILYATNSIQQALTSIQKIRDLGTFVSNQKLADVHNQSIYGLIIIISIILTVIMFILSRMFGINRQLERYIYVLFQMIQIK